MRTTFWQVTEGVLTLIALMVNRVPSLMVSVQSIFQPSEQAISLAKECVSQGCSVHLFVLSQQDVGGAWPGHVPYLTGGGLHTYSHLQVRQDPHAAAAREMKG